MDKKEIFKIIVYGALFGFVSVIVATIALYIIQAILPLMMFN